MVKGHSTPNRNRAHALGATENQDLDENLFCTNCRNSNPNEIVDLVSGELVCGDCEMVLEAGPSSRCPKKFPPPNKAADTPCVVTHTPELDVGQFDDGIKPTSGDTILAKKIPKTLYGNFGTKGTEYTAKAHREIATLCNTAGLSRPVSDSAKRIFDLVTAIPSFKPQIRQGLLAACIFCACRQENDSRTFREVAAFTPFSKDEIAKCFKAITPFLEKAMKGTTSAVDLVGRLCSSLGLPSEVQMVAADLVVRATAIQSLTSRSPISLAAGALYFTTQLFNSDKTLQEISEASGSSTSTIRVVYKRLYAERTSLVDLNSYCTPVTFNSLPRP